MVNCGRVCPLSVALECDIMTTVARLLLCGNKLKEIIKGETLLRRD